MDKYLVEVAKWLDANPMPSSTTLKAMRFISQKVNCRSSLLFPTFYINLGKVDVSIFQKISGLAMLLFPQISLSFFTYPPLASLLVQVFILWTWVLYRVTFSSFVTSMIGKLWIISISRPSGFWFLIPGHRLVYINFGLLKFFSTYKSLFSFLIGHQPLVHFP